MAKINLLDRHSAYSSSLLTEGQVRLDASLEAFRSEASNVENIAAMGLASGVFHAMKVGGLSLAARRASWGARALSYAAALGGEVSAYRSAHSLFASLQGRESPESAFDRRAWWATFSDFLALKAAGGLAPGWNAIGSQALQSSTLVASHQVTAKLGLSERPQGSLFEQWVQAQGSSLALGLGQSLFGWAGGGRLRALEKSLEFSLDSENRPALRQRSLPAAVEALSMASPREVQALVQRHALAVESAGDILPAYRGTPVGRLLEYHNLGIPLDPHQEAELIVGMCMDNRKSLRMPDNFAYVLRAGGANLRRLEFKVAFAVSRGIRSVALIGHTDCGMAELANRKEAFIRGMVENAGWTEEAAREFFEQSAPAFEIGNPVDFTMDEAERLGRRFPRVLVAPLLYRVEDRRLYQLRR